MDIDGLGPAVVEQLVDRGLVGSLPDLYRLQATQLANLEHYGQKSADKLCRKIANSKQRGLRSLLTGLGIRHVGERNARQLAEAFGRMDALARATVEELDAIPGLGSVVAVSVHQFFHNVAGRKTILELRKLGLRMTEKQLERREKTSGSLAGKTVVVTGTLSRHTRSEAEALIFRAGGKATSSVSANTDLVVVGDQPGTKLDRARILGVKTLNEKQFLKLLAKSQIAALATK
jgi:DNA ligase (NAD+)